MNDCPFKEARTAAPIRPTLPAMPVKRNPGPVDRELHFPQQNPFDQAHRRVRAGTCRGKSQAYNLIAEKARVSNEVGAGSGAWYTEQEP